MLLGAGLVLVGSAVLYFAVTGNDPRKLLASGAVKASKLPKIGPAPTFQQKGQL